MKKIKPRWFVRTTIIEAHQKALFHTFPANQDTMLHSDTSDLEDFRIALIQGS